MHIPYAVAFVLATQSSGQMQEIPVAPPDVLAFVREALQERLNANAVPDFRLPAATTRVAIREEMSAAKMKLNESALPHVDGVEFYLLSTTAAQAQADQTRSDLFFLIVDSPQVRSATGTLLLGTDVVLWHDPAQQRVKLCCCDEQAAFTKTENRWVFAGRLGATCR